jgi:hypothetical protein
MPPQSCCRLGHAAAVPAHCRGLDAGMRKRSPLPCATTHARAVPSRATMRALAWRGQGQTFGSLSLQTLSALRPATGRGFAVNGDPPRECERQLDPVLTHLLRRMSAPTQSSPCPPRTKPKHLDRDHLVALLHLAAENVLPPGRTSVRPSQCMCSSARTHAGEHLGVLPRSSPPWPSHRHAYTLK